MTNGEPSERWATLDEIEADLKAQYRRHLELLAWIIRQDVQPLDLRREANWPAACDVATVPVLSWLATRDLAIWDLARAQLASEFEEASIEAPSATVDMHHLRLAAHMLSSWRPSPRGPSGDNLARNVVLHSLLGLFEDEDWNPWGIRGKAPSPFKSEGSDFGPASKSALATKLSEELEAHPLLVDLPDAVPSAEAIRAVWKRLAVARRL